MGISRQYCFFRRCFSQPVEFHLRQRSRSMLHLTTSIVVQRPYSGLATKRIRSLSLLPSVFYTGIIQKARNMSLSIRVDFGTVLGLAWLTRSAFTKNRCRGGMLRYG